MVSVMSCPVVVVDVDGVLVVAPDALPGGLAAVRDLGYQAHEFDGLGPDGSRARGTVCLNTEHGAWLREVCDQGAELVWARAGGGSRSRGSRPGWGCPSSRSSRSPVVDPISAGRPRSARSSGGLATDRSPGSMTRWAARSRVGSRNDATTAFQP